MEKHVIGGVTIDRCEACHALWLDAKELERILTIKGSERSLDAKDTDGADTVRKRGTPTRRGKRACPRDGAALAEMEFPTQSHIMIDKCPTCGGMLLDAGELRDIKSFTLLERVRGFFA